jgi:hypothetical protein
MVRGRGARVSRSDGRYPRALNQACCDSRGLFAVVELEGVKDEGAGGGFAVGGRTEALEAQLGGVEHLLAALGEADAFFVEAQRVVEGELAVFEGGYGLVETAEGLFEGERFFGVGAVG